MALVDYVLEVVCQRDAEPPEDERPFQRRLMEVAAGFAEQAGNPHL